MIETTFNPADRYMKMLMPLSADIKLDLITRLSASLKNTIILPIKQEAKTDNFFSELSGAWEDQTSVREILNSSVVDNIR